MSLGEGKNIRLSNGIYEDKVFALQPGQTIVGDTNSRIRGSFTCKSSGNIVFENVVFVSHGETIQFNIPGSVLFHHCTFLLDTKHETDGMDTMEGVNAGRKTFIYLSRGSFDMLGCFFVTNAEGISSLSLVIVHHNAKLQVRSTKFTLNLVSVNAVYLFSGLGKNPNRETGKIGTGVKYETPSLLTNSNNITVNVSGLPINFILVRNKFEAILSLMGTSIFFESGEGTLIISQVDSLVFVNSLCAIAKDALNWSIGDYKHLLLSSFVSNIQGCGDLSEVGVIEPNKENKPAVANIIDDELRGLKEMLTGQDTWK